MKAEGDVVGEPAAKRTGKPTASPVTRAASQTEDRIHTRVILLAPTQSKAEWRADGTQSGYISFLLPWCKMIDALSRRQAWKVSYPSRKGAVGPVRRPHYRAYTKPTSGRFV